MMPLRLRHRLPRSADTPFTARRGLAHCLDADERLIITRFAQAAEKEARMKRFAEMFGKTDLSDQEEIANIAAGGAAPAAPGLKGDGDGGNEPAAGACGT